MPVNTCLGTSKRVNPKATRYWVANADNNTKKKRARGMSTRKRCAAEADDDLAHAPSDRANAHSRGSPDIDPGKGQGGGGGDSGCTMCYQQIKDACSAPCTCSHNGTGAKTNRKVAPHLLPRHFKAWFLEQHHI